MGTPTNQAMSAQEGDFKTDVEDRKADLSRARVSAILDVLLNILFALLFLGFGALSLILHSAVDIFLAILPSSKYKAPILLLNLFLSVVCVLETLLITLGLVPGVVVACFVGDFCTEWWNIILMLRICINGVAIFWKVVMVLVMFHATRALGKPKPIDPDRDIKIGKVYAGIHIVAEIVWGLHGFFFINPLETIVCIFVSLIVLVRWRSYSKIPFVIQVIVLVPICVLHITRACAVAITLTITSLVTGSLFTLNIIGLFSGIFITYVMVGDIVLFMIRLIACSASVFALEEMYRRKLDPMRVGPEKEDANKVAHKPIKRQPSIARHMAMRRRASFADSVDMTMVKEELDRGKQKSVDPVEALEEGNAVNLKGVKTLEIGNEQRVNTTEVRKAQFPSVADEEPFSTPASAPGPSLASVQPLAEVKVEAAAVVPESEMTEAEKEAHKNSLDVLRRANLGVTSPRKSEAAASTPVAMSKEPAGQEQSVRPSGAATTENPREETNVHPSIGAVGRQESSSAVAQQPTATADETVVVEKKKKKKAKWKEYKTEDGTPYYYNRETKVTQWERPDDM